MELLSSHEKWIYADQATSHEYEKGLLIINNGGQPSFSELTSGQCVDPSQVGPNRVEILCTYCSQCGTRVVEHPLIQLPYDQSTLHQLLEHTPWLLTMRSHSKGLGNFSKHLRYQADKPITMALIFHPSMKQYWRRSRGGSVWSLGLVYDVRYNTLTGILDGLLPADRRRLECSLSSNPEALAHPLAVPCAVLETQTTFLIEAAKEIHTELFKIETDFSLFRFGHSRSRNNPWSMSNEKFQDYMKRSGSLHSHVTYLKGQVDLLIRFQEFLLKTSDQLQELVKCNEDVPAVVAIFRKQPITYWCENLDNILQSIKHNVERSLLRIDKFSETLSTVMNYQISKDSSHNSSLATTISLITMIFLPATAVATFFSMSIFNFQNNAAQLVSDHFWIYWAVMAPLTVVILSLCYLWSIRESLGSLLAGSKRTKGGSPDQHA